MKWTSIITLVTLGLLTASCDSDKKDFSYTPEEYRQVGFPDHQKSWDGKDFKDACNLLYKIKYQKPLSLPRKNSHKSGEIFEHLISMDNLAFLENDTLPLHIKAYTIPTYLDIQGELHEIYYDVQNTEQYYSTELVHIYIFGLRIAEEMLKLAGLINMSDDENDKSMQYEFRSIHLSYMKMLQYALDRLNSQSQYSTEDFTTFGDSIAKSVQRNLHWFDSLSVSYIKPMLQSVVDNSESVEISKEYHKLMDSLPDQGRIKIDDLLN